jgi:hypothetical protein
VGKFVGKFRQERDYSDDYGYNGRKPKRKRENREIRKMKMRQYDEDGYAFDGPSPPSKHKSY